MTNDYSSTILAQQSGGQPTYPEWVLAIMSLIILVSAARELMDLTDEEISFSEYIGQILWLVIPIPEVLNRLRFLERVARLARKGLVYLVGVALSVGVLFQISKVLQPSSTLEWALAPLAGALVSFATAQAAVKFTFYLWQGTESVIQELIGGPPDGLERSLSTQAVRIGITLALIAGLAYLWYT